MASILRLLRRGERRPKDSLSQAMVGPSSAAQGRVVCEGRVRVKGTGFYNIWKPAWVELRESHEWKPIIELYDEDPNVCISSKDVLPRLIYCWC
jgi:hypothetical protein